MAEQTTTEALADLTARRDALLKKRESLVTKAKDGDQEVSYDLSQTDAALAELDKQIRAMSVTKRRRYAKAVTRSGW